MSERAVLVDRVSKAYAPRSRRATLVEELYRRLSGAARRRPRRWVLRDVSFELEAGRSLGVIGKNGAGKSTLMKILAGISRPTSGRVEVPVRVSTQFALGAGFHPYLTGEENAYLQGTILGLTNREVRARLPAIAEFADIGEAMHRPLWTYSTGMVSRLAFAVAAHAHADLMLLDEALSAGDASFHERCRRTLEEARAGGRTLIVVSHDMGSIARLCDEVLWLDHGAVRGLGRAEEVLADYQSHVEDPSR